MKTTLVILFAFAIGTCYNNQFLRNLADVTVSKVTSDNCVDLVSGAQIVLAATAASGTATAVTTATDLGITLEAGTDKITTKCTMTAELVITCTTEKAAATATSAVQYSVKVTEKTVTDKFKTTTLTNAITHKAGVNKPIATQADAAKKINYGEAKEEDLAFTIEFGADVGATVPKVKANTKELTCTKDSENGKKLKCTFDEETLPADKDDSEKEVAYPVTYTNECGTESSTGITVTVSSSAFNTLSKFALLIVGLFLL